MEIPHLITPSVKDHTECLGYLYLRPDQWSPVIPRPKNWVVSFHGIKNPADAEYEQVDVEWALDGDKKNTFTTKELRPETESNGGLWERLWKAKTVELRNTQQEPVWFALWVLPPGSRP